MLSIITCTYNPNPIIFNRLIKAINGLIIPDNATIEWIIIDNNSNQSIEKLFDFSFIQIPQHHIVEFKPGLTSARIAGIKAAKYDWLVFFDDDNEPANDYLIKAVEAISQFPQTGAWGPGTVNVEYTDKTTPQWLNKYKSIFQQRNDEKVKYDNNSWWQFCYPFGTGLIIKKIVCEEYILRVEKKHYLLSDRKGKSLSSGGDMQIVYTALAMNFYAGVAPEIKLNHLISKSKSNQNYIARLLYGSAACNLPAYFQCYPNNFQRPEYPTTKEVIRKCYYFFKVVLLKDGFRELHFQFSRYLGELEGIVLLNRDIKKAKFVLIIERILKLR